MAYNSSSKYSPEMLDMVQQLVSRKSDENAQLKAKIEDLKDKLKMRNNMETNLINQHKIEVNKLKKDLSDGNDELQNLMIERDRLRKIIAKNSTDLKEARGRTNKILAELNKLKNDIKENYITNADHELILKEKYISKDEHDQVLSASKNLMKQLQSEIELFRKDLDENVTMKGDFTFMPPIADQADFTLLATNSRQGGNSVTIEQNDQLGDFTIMTMNALREEDSTSMDADVFETDFTIMEK